MSEKTRITLRELADAAKVSIATASRVVNGSTDVNPAMQKRVHDAMYKLNYTPKTARQSTQFLSRLSVGILVNDFSDTAYTPLLRGFLEVANSLDMDVSIYETMRQAAAESAGIKKFLASGVNGIISIPPNKSINPDLVELNQQHFPLVFIINPNSSDNSLLKGINYVQSDSRGVYSAAKYLLDLGHRNIVYLGDPNIPRFSGYQQALQDSGIPINHELVTDCNDSFGAAYDLTVNSFRKGKYTAILCVSENVAMGARFALTDMGLSVPDDCSIIGYDNSTVPCYIPITAVVEPLTEIGKNAANMIYEVIRNPYAAPRSVVLNDSLVIRGSCKRI